MTPYRTLLYIAKRKRKFRKLLMPLTFFILEISLIIMFFMNVLGINLIPFGEVVGTEPIVFIRGFHSLEMIDPFEFYAENIPYLSLNESVSPVTIFLHGVSFIVAMIGLWISILWMNRFFNINQLNIEWWMWPTGCIGAHTMCFLVLI